MSGLPRPYHCDQARSSSAKEGEHHVADMSLGGVDSQAITRGCGIWTVESQVIRSALA